MDRMSYKRYMRCIWVYAKYTLRKKRKKVMCIVGVILSISILLLATMTVDIVNLEGIWGGRNTQTIQDLQAQVQQVADDNMFRVKLNTQPSMNVDTGATSIIVQNAVDNPYSKKVAYYNEKGEVIYETNLLNPGDNELSAIFPGKWIEGAYPMEAVVIAVDKETNEEFIISEIDIELTVKKK